MTICVIRWEIKKNTNDEYKAHRFKIVKKFSNDHFDDKFNIFLQKDWLNFLLENKDKYGLAQFSADGTLLCWSITTWGARRDVREFFANSRQTSAHLFPQSKNFKDENLKILMNYNMKYIFPHIPKVEDSDND